MRFVVFCHSLLSCWNHGNAHFLRGVLRELLARGHAVRSFEPADGWSRANLLHEPGGAEALERFAADFPELAAHARVATPDLDEMLDGADVAIVHEWNDPALVAAIGEKRRQGGRFTLLFHDTHHRAVTDPDAIGRLRLEHYDAILAFGESLAQVYRVAGWGSRSFVWHEAADARLFRPVTVHAEREGVVWIGNWGDEERSAELRAFLLQPVAALGLPLDIYGVRYPDAALKDIAAAGGRYRGWLANARAPEVFARHQMTVHVPRRAYAAQLPGIPTIRVFEALACAVPLVCAPWQDSEGLFDAGRDYLLAPTPAAMGAQMARLRADPALRAEIARNGLETVRRRHTCAHRADELLDILGRIGGRRGAA